MKLKNIFIDKNKSNKDNNKISQNIKNRIE